MKTLIMLPIIFIGTTLKSNSEFLKGEFRTFNDPVANAGPDQTIYLNQTSTATLDGSLSFADSYLWKNISTDFTSGAITLVNSKVTTVTGLEQGTFYYELSATTGDITKKDTVVVRVEYDVPPANATLIRNFNMSDPSIWGPINDRSDTINYYPVTNQTRSQAGSVKDSSRVLLFRARANGLTIDSCRGKLISLIEDGYAGERPAPNAPTYSRAEVQLSGASFRPDTLHTYVFEWKGYLPNDTNYLQHNGLNWGKILAMFQIHGGIYDYAVVNFDMDYPGNVTFNNMVTGVQKPPSAGAFYQSIIDTLAPFSFFHNRSHTIRITVREGLGYVGQRAFLKLEIDGMEKYYRDTGGVGSAYFDDYVKFGGLYDYGRKMVNPDSLTRGRKFALVTESFRIYRMDNLDNNKVPIANAGVNKTITLPVNTISISGNGTDADGFIVSYLWTKISGPTNFKIVNPSLPATDITGMVEGEYVFQLKVTDDKGAIGTSTVKVTVNPAPNIAPVAIAGADKTITLPTNSVSLSGSGTDADGSVVSYAWSKLSGPSAFKIANPSSATTDVSGMAEGVYVFELKVTDNKGATGTSTVKITVNPAPNIAPVAIAGANKIITLPVNMVSLAGSGSDADGKIVGYLWMKISGPAFFKIVNPSSPVTDVTGLVEGEYVFELKVTDDKGAAGTARVQISVKAGLDNLNSAVPNVAPKANAGNDTTVTAPVTVITLKGTGTDVDGRITGYLWTQISGPSKSNLSPNNEASVNVSNVIEGTYEFELKVTDNDGGVGKDTVRITVVATRMATDGDRVIINPNPVNDIATLEINTPKNNTNFSVLVTDMGGKTIYKEQFVSPERKLIKQIDTRNFVRGTYIVTVVFDGTEKASVKIVRM